MRSIEQGMAHITPDPQKPLYVSRLDLRSAALCALILLFSPAAMPGDVTAVNGTPAAIISQDADDAAEDDDYEDDGSAALGDLFQRLHALGVQPISLEEEQALLGNWGDTDAEDGD